MTHGQPYKTWQFSSPSDQRKLENQQQAGKKGDQRQGQGKWKGWQPKLITSLLAFRPEEGTKSSSAPARSSESNALSRVKS